MIISLDAEKVGEKNSTAFIIKILERSEIQGTFLNKIKTLCGKPMANNDLWRKTHNNSLKIRKKTQRCPLSPYLLNIELGVISRTIRQLKEIKGKEFGKEKDQSISIFK